MSPAFGHGVEDLIFTAVTSGSMEGLGISHATAYPSARSTISNMSSPRQSISSKAAWYDAAAMARGRSFTAPAQHTMPPTPQTAALPPTLVSQPVPIAPHPASATMRHGKRLRNDDQYESGRSPQRRRSNSTNQNQQISGGNRPQTELSEEDQLLLKLKHEENLPWKDIAREFETRLGRTYQVPALQMRHKRLRERLRTWTEDDVSALEAAYEHWEKSKFEIVAQKVRADPGPCLAPAITDTDYRCSSLVRKRNGPQNTANANGKNSILKPPPAPVSLPRATTHPYRWGLLQYLPMRTGFHKARTRISSMINLHLPCQ
jgi:hypothetical protein